ANILLIEAPVKTNSYYLSLRIDKCLKPLSILPSHEYHYPQKRVQNKEVFCEYANLFFAQMPHPTPKSILNN
uniref:hypothetical protein n=1 Tax=Carboxylicivirga taeanensis TaxID=1416875 RepID=UPI003F6DDF40